MSKPSRVSFKLWINLITFIAIIVIVIFAWSDLGDAFKKMASLNYWILLLMIPAQLFVFFALAKMFYHFFAAVGSKVSIKTLFRTVLELNFVNHIFPSGGVSGFSYMTLRLKPVGISTAKTTLAQLARFGLTLLGFIVLMLAALVMLSVEDRTNTLVVLVVSAITFTILFSTGILIFVISNERRIAGFSRGLAKSLNKILQIFRPRHPEIIKLGNVETTFLELHRDYVLIKNDFGKMRWVVVWAMLLNIAELSLLFVVFLAHGEWVNPGALIVAFVIANIVGLIAILPGGLGVYEPLMTAVLISSGVPAVLALSATLVYRVISLLLSLLFGYISYQIFIHKYGTNLQRQ